MKKIANWIKNNTKKFLIADLLLVLLACGIIFASKTPGDVEGLEASSDSYSTATLSWNEAENARSYRIYRSDNGKNFKYIGTISGTSYTDKKLRTGTTYYYTIMSRNLFSGSKLLPDNAVSVTPKLGVPELTVETENGKMQLSFTEVDGATGYEIIRNGEVIDNIYETSYVDTGAIGDTDYKYEVRAYRYKKKPVVGGFSNAVSAILHAIQDFNVKIREDDLVVSWNKSKYYTKFKVYNGKELLAETNDNEFVLSDYDLDTVYDIKMTGYADDGTKSPKNKRRFIVTEEEMTNEDARLEACEWGLDIAADNSFTYGTGKRAHNFGCYFCGTNTGPRMNKKGTGKVSGHTYTKTYCCNPFVTACYAHGAGDPGVLADCQRGRGFDFKQSTFTKHGNWKSIGKPALSTLQPGDVICWQSHMMLYVGNNTIVHAKTEGWGAGSITTDNAARYYKRAKYVMRYSGNGRGIKRVIRDVDSLGNVINSITKAEKA